MTQSQSFAPALRAWHGGDLGAREPRGQRGLFDNQYYKLLIVRALQYVERLARRTGSAYLAVVIFVATIFNVSVVMY